VNVSGEKSTSERRGLLAIFEELSIKRILSWVGEIGGIAFSIISFVEATLGLIDVLSDDSSSLSSDPVDIAPHIACST
jgi:hypothetical protein